MTDAPKTLRDLLDELGGAMPAADVLHAMLPLMRAVGDLHARDLVAALKPDQVLVSEDRALALRQACGQAPKFNEAELRALQPHQGSALRIVGEYRVTTDTESGQQVDDLSVVEENGAEDRPKPAYILDYGCWEHRVGHHDAMADVFSAGLILVSLACGLDLSDEIDLKRFAEHRDNLFRLNPSLHPALAQLIVEMTALNRHERATDMLALARRLENYRDQPVSADVERVLAEATGAAGRRRAVLTHLRDRLFDLSRRNKLIHFRQTEASVNLTVASVPLVMQLQSIRAEQLCVWGGPFANEVLSGAPTSLVKWLRFEDQPYLPSAFDRILQATRRDRAEYGFSHLRLVVAFLRWNNLKEAPDERVVSPLLWLPVELTKKKGVRDQYVLRAIGADAEFNPALRYHLRQLYDIRLPESVNLAQTALDDVRADLAAQIQQSEPSVTLALRTAPEIELIHDKAVQRMRRFQRRQRMSAPTGYARPDFSYDKDDYRPLGLALFEKYVRPSPLPQRMAAGAPPAPRVQRMHEMAAPDEKLGYALSEGKGNRYAWDIDLTQVTLANLNYRKMSLIQDYTQLLESGAPAPSFERVFSIEPRPIDETTSAPLAAADNWAVVPADATQEAAVGLARNGRSFIIQGPPGTGKSQTITNLIADYVARGKRVLFVCEKRAALDVVFSRLRLAGLDRLACLIHDSQEDKKAFVHDLKHCYESWSQSEDGAVEVGARRAEVVAALEHHLGKIKSFEQGVTHVSPATGVALRNLARRLAALPEADGLNSTIRERLPDLAEWDRQAALTQRLYSVMRNVFGLDSLAEHAFARLAPQVVADEHSFAKVQALVGEAQELLAALDESMEDETTLLSGELTLAEAADLVQAAVEAVETGLARNLDLLDPVSAASAAFAQLDAARAQAAATATTAAETARGWVEALAAQDARAALDQAKRQQGSLFRFIDPSWWRLRRAVRARYRFSQHAVQPSMTQVLEWLVARHAADDAAQAAGAALNARFNCKDADALSRVREQWMSGAKATTARLLEHAGKIDGGASIANEARAAESVRRLSALLRETVIDADGASLNEIAEALRDMEEGLEDLPDLIPHLRDLDASGASLAYALRTVPLDAEQMEAAIVAEAAARALRASPELIGFDVAALTSSSRKAASARRILQESNVQCVSANCQRQFHDHLKRSMLSVTELDGAGRAFKKTYSAGRRELEREFAKTMRYHSIRDLAAEDTGAVVNDLKPVWLMSPLSVSDTLPLRHDLFDVVIFDEASQIPMEEAVPALSRAAQVIIVGDEMQLPPTSFFSAARDDDEALVTAEDEDGDAIAILLDADSLLNQAARTLPATLLAWHYRSRSEALINFSNAAFYDGRLVTIPDRVLPAMDAAPPPALQSNDPAAPNAAVDHLLARPISFHAVADGVYEARANVPEAKLIARMVREIFQRETKLSIGIVAFSEAQQSEIERALDALADEDKVFGARLDEEYAREDEGQINDLFVKNLENVQGDERDIILMSVCYAPDKNGRMAMNFGPINQRGGEKRLNVIFSRARHHMAIVSTIRASAITNTHNDGARALASFLAFAEAQARGEVAGAQAILATLNPDARRVFAAAAPKDALRDAIAAALRERGLIVREHVGSSTFRCDLAITGADERAYSLAILIDGGTPTGVYDRYVFRPSILRNFGWRVIDIPSQAWLRDADAVLEEIERALLADPAAQDDDPFDHGAPQPPRAKPRKPTEGQSPPPVQGALQFTELRFEEGASKKFWKVAVAGSELTIIFGRIGANGGTLLKTFPTEDRAKRERAKLIAEKLAKGYTEV